MSEDNTPKSVGEMLRFTGENTANFMIKVAEHIEKLETIIKELTDRVNELENQNDRDATESE